MKINLNYMREVLFKSLGIMLFLFTALILISGSTASMILLYKMFPELGLELIEKFLKILTGLIYVLQFILVLYVIYSLTATCLVMKEELKKSKQKRLKKREVFLDDLATKLMEKGILTEVKKKK